jgi:hypothetical protein
MSWYQYIALFPAVIFFSAILTLALQHYLKKRHRRLQQKQMSTSIWPLSTEISSTEVSAPTPASEDDYEKEINAILAELRRSEKGRLSPGNRNQSLR